MQMDARNSASGEIVFKDNFSQAVAGIVEVSWLFCLICNFFVALFFCCSCFLFPLFVSLFDNFAAENLLSFCWLQIASLKTASIIAKTVTKAVTKLVGEFAKYLLMFSICL